MKTYVVRTLGCKANLHDSQLIEAELQRRGWRPLAPGGRAPELCIVNSCTVTDEADRQSRKLAVRLGRENPRARVVVTGCGAEVEPERLASSKGIHYVVGNRDKPRLVELILEQLAREPEGGDPSSGAPSSEDGSVLGVARSYEQMLSRHPLDREWPAAEAAFSAPPAALDGHSRKTRAFLKIQEGCNEFCTYCVIPYGRGPSRSLRPRELIAQVRGLVAQGAREIVLTGTNIGDYGGEWAPDGVGEPPLTELAAMILGETALERLRVSSLDPAQITPGLIALMERETRFCPHLHVSLQSASSRVLRLMKRGYGADEVRDQLLRISSICDLPGGTFVGMDVITGFPGEGDEEFQETREALKSLPWSRLHVFPYSERAGTPALRLPGRVPPEMRARRARELGALSLERMGGICRQVVASCASRREPLRDILLERPFAGAPRGYEGSSDARWWIAGYTRNYLKILIPLPEARTEEEARQRQNQLVSARPLAALADPAAGEVALVSELVS